MTAAKGSPDGRRGWRRIVTAAQGTGPLLQRDYRAVLADCLYSPEHVMKIVRAGFPLFAPRDLVRFSRDGSASREPAVGDELEVGIKLAGSCHVRIVETDDRSLTMRTNDDHPEAGRITFAAERDERGRVVLHIRSRARANGLLRFLGYELMGRDMQTRVWLRFLERVAVVCGAHVVGGVQESTRKVSDSPGDAPVGTESTLVAS